MASLDKSQQQNICASRLSRLPAEISDQIVYEVHDPPSLKALRLTNTGCDNLIIRHLFHQVPLSLIEESLNSFRNIVLRPRLAQHVRAVIFSDVTGGPQAAAFAGFQRSILPLLAAMSGLQNLIIDRPTNLDDFPPDPMEANHSRPWTPPSQLPHYEGLIAWAIERQTCRARPRAHSRMRIRLQERPVPRSRVLEHNYILTRFMENAFYGVRRLRLHLDRLDAQAVGQVLSGLTAVQHRLVSLTLTFEPRKTPWWRRAEEQCNSPASVNVWAMFEDHSHRHDISWSCLEELHIEHYLVSAAELARFVGRRKQTLRRLRLGNCGVTVVNIEALAAMLHRPHFWLGPHSTILRLSSVTCGPASVRDQFKNSVRGTCSRRCAADHQHRPGSRHCCGCQRARRRRRRHLSELARSVRHTSCWS
ncbi:hypothetical protein Micbo1qcDRAFT_6883 [Microdochium bolleyi]|uniref:Uncharacterized protein n=1 Tax=Microdochium bolleyi TaxID=196109 RepID=A0A136JJF8_9PEZI|nr:hypothetical protein Micbo1qcDRAFT_6883 [Microdochium bolleyi]